MIEKGKVVIIDDVYIFFSFIRVIYKIVHCLLFSDIAAVEEWLVKITLHQGLNIYATEGTLLDSVRGKCQKMKVEHNLYIISTTLASTICQTLWQILDDHDP